MSLGVHGGRRFNVSMVRRASRAEREGGREWEERSNWLEGGSDGRTFHPPPTRNGPPADTRQIPTILYQLSPPPSRRPDRQTSKSRRPRSVVRPKKRVSEPGGRGNINIQFLLLIVIQIILSFLPRSPRSYARPMDGWIVDGWSIRGDGRAGGLGRRRAPLGLLQAPPPSDFS